MTLTIEQLTAEWQILKKRENAAKESRLMIEQEILSLAELKEQGTTTLGEIKITTGYAQKWDQEAIVTYLKDKGLPLMPFKTEFKPDTKKMNALKEAYPADYAELERAALTLTEKKPTFIEVK